MRRIDWDRIVAKAVEVWVAVVIMAVFLLAMSIGGTE